MSAIFTDFVRSLEAGLESDSLTRVWSALRAALRQELKRRGLWSAPPFYLGIYGWASWEQGERGGDPSSVAWTDDDPLAELTAESYSFIFIDRLPALQSQLAIKPNIEGLVLLNVRHFLHERQQHHDPLGFRVFERLQAAVLEGIAQGDFFVLGGDPGVRNDTVIGLDLAAEPVPPARDLSAIVGCWNDDLLPDLVAITRGQQQQELLARLRAHLRDLAGAGLTSFRIRDIVDPLKNDTRARWAARLDAPGRNRETLSAVELEIETHGRLRRPPSLVSCWRMRRRRSSRLSPSRATSSRSWIISASLPALSTSRSNDFEVIPSAWTVSRTRGGIWISIVDLAQRVAVAIDALATDRRTRRYLSSLWQYLSSQASSPAGTLREEGAALEEEEWGQLSHRKLARRLDIPRERMPDLFVALRQLVASSRAGGPRSTAPPGADVPVLSPRGGTDRTPKGEPYEQRGLKPSNLTERS